MTTARDLATHLNVSVSTVGRALADDPRISDETKFRVRQAAIAFGYVGNRAARMMRGVRSNVVGVVVPDVQNSFYSTVAHALAVTMRDHEHQVMLCETGDDRETELQQIRELAAAHVAGVVIVPTPKPHPEVRRLLSNIPYVQLNRRVVALNAPWFGLDDEAAMHMATKHLLDLGHRRIAYIGGAPSVPTGASRLAGFRAALAAAAIKSDEQLIDVGPPSSVAHGVDAFRRICAVQDQPTGLVVSSVQLTVGVLTAAYEDGIAVPEVLSVVGFGDDPGFAWWGPGLTTIAPPVHELATASGMWLLHHLENGDSDATREPFASVSPAHLIVRGSTAAPSSET